MNPSSNFVGLWLLTSSVALLLTGCAQSTVTNPARSATEQLLLSTAADRAIQKISFHEFTGKRVYCDTSYFESYDSRYVLGAVRDALSRAGALLESEAGKSEITVELRSGAFSIDGSDSLLGIPKSGIPVPLAGAVDIPELALYKASRQNSVAKFAILAYASETHTNIYSSGPRIGEAYNHYYKILGFIRWTRTDLPEKARK